MVLSLDDPRGPLGSPSLVPQVLRPLSHLTGAVISGPQQACPVCEDPRPDLLQHIHKLFRHLLRGAALVESHQEMVSPHVAQQLPSLNGRSQLVLNAILPHLAGAVPPLPKWAHGVQQGAMLVEDSAELQRRQPNRPLPLSWGAPRRIGEAPDYHASHAVHHPGGRVEASGPRQHDTSQRLKALRGKASKGKVIQVRHQLVVRIQQRTDECPMEDGCPCPQVLGGVHLPPERRLLVADRGRP
mmetsp:Transcript_8030/g.23017  ORF Transcript_8030/g.23017 Transcript_8030/m.23017 type:complete len:242 (+) Transcript_8030:1676-2401(+)